MQLNLRTSQRIEKFKIIDWTWFQLNQHFTSTLYGEMELAKNSESKEISYLRTPGYDQKLYQTLNIKYWKHLYQGVYLIDGLFDKFKRTEYWRNTHFRNFEYWWKLQETLKAKFK